MINQILINTKGKLFHFLNFVLNSFYKFKKSYRRLFLFLVDAFLIYLSIYIVNYLYYPIHEKGIGSYLENLMLPFLILVSIFVNYLTGQYLSLSRYIKSSEIYQIAFRNLILIFLLISFEFLYINEPIKYKPFFLFWVVVTLITIISRFSLKEIINSLKYFNSKRICRVAIYGAGAAGAQLASSLILEGNHKVVAFFDDSSNLWGRKLLGISIYSSVEMHKFKGKVDQVLLAIPSLSSDSSRNLIQRIQSFELPVLKVPSIEALTLGKARIDSLQPIDVEDLLGRGPVTPYKKLLGESIDYLNICITGAGGSIGRELCKQVLVYKPKSLILIDSSEANLYHLDQEIIQTFLKENKLKCQLILGNVTDYNFTKHIFQTNSIDIVFHAAAYKHVPLIEINPLKGIENNVFSTYTICKAAEFAKVKRVTLISTDKAVRPSNVMGASKRLAEIIIQAYADKVKFEDEFIQKKGTKFSIVRFGNVLNSSGSVVPLFKKQISIGGPITLTHENVIRYFMTLAEAAQLVIQSTSLSEGGEVFLLDMGQPVRIFDLAKQMIRLSGLSVKDSKNTNGDIEIKITGLRPGEKLYEELLIDAESHSTEHPLIFKAVESFIPYEELCENLNLLGKYINLQDKDKVFEILLKMVPQWQKS